MNQEVYIDPELENWLKEDKGYINYIDKNSFNTYLLIHYGVLRTKKLMHLLRFGKIVSIVKHYDSHFSVLVYCVKVELYR